MSEDSSGTPSPDRAATGSQSVGSAGGERAPNTLLNGLIGGIVGVLLSFVPFSTVLGGGVAGYLEGGDYAAGAKVGAIAGLIAFVPIVLVIGVILFFVPVTGVLGPAVPGARVQFAVWVSVLAIVLFAAAYAIGLSVIGGVLGAYLKEEV